MVTGKRNAGRPEPELVALVTPPGDRDIVAFKFWKIIIIPYSVPRWSVISAVDMSASSVIVVELSILNHTILYAIQSCLNITR